MNDKIVTFKTFDNSINANIIKGLLDSHGIPGFLESENIVTLNPLYSNAVGGIRLSIFEKDFEKANDIVNAKNIIFENYGEEKNKEDQLVTKCIYCNSEDVSYGLSSNRRFGFISMLFAFLLMVYPFLYRRKFHCFSCGNEFTAKTKIENKQVYILEENNEK